ncbi:MAG: hypothetical protein NXI18_18575 [Alphaproteobacteria bacterium]|nr:hypothetical protein [Alphaproteobacteria bacterium]
MRQFWSPAHLQPLILIQAKPAKSRPISGYKVPSGHIGIESEAKILTVHCEEETARVVGRNIDDVRVTKSTSGHQIIYQQAVYRQQSTETARLSHLEQPDEDAVRPNLKIQTEHMPCHVATGIRPCPTILSEKHHQPATVAA